MLKFTEYAWDRSVQEFVEACNTAGLDPQQELYNEFLGLGGLWNRLTGRKQQEVPDDAAIMRNQRRMVGPMNNPSDKGKLIPSTQGARSFSDNSGYAKVISQEIQKGIPGLLRNVYSAFRQQHPNHDDNKVKSFFNAVSTKLSSSVADIMNRVSTKVDGEKFSVNDPHMNKMAKPLAPPKGTTPPPTVKMNPAAMAPKPDNDPTQRINIGKNLGSI